ncbi:hypothetical protein [Variovorax paradoxus]|uniref:Uncharacterized protein n=1 Tax=Variovorax paradoxus TaxID=34073 RepID=A0A679JBP5_VARPD|nr:hypothetical protein VVAX_03598 [Variovorax paradoxus]
MTRPGFGALSSAVARAQAEIRQQHCPPPSYYPTAAVRSSMKCTRCGGLLNYTVSPIGARTTGRCSSAGCIEWRD